MKRFFSLLYVVCLLLVHCACSTVTSESMPIPEQMPTQATEPIADPEFVLWQEIECADGSISKVYVYQLAEEKWKMPKGPYKVYQPDGTVFVLDYKENIDSTSTITVHNENDIVKQVLEVEEFVHWFSFRDIDLDGICDLDLKTSGTLNESHELFLYDSDEGQYIRVGHEEVLAYFEVYDGYLLNWLKDSYDSGLMQKLVWDGTDLVIVSEEPYHANE